MKTPVAKEGKDYGGIIKEVCLSEYYIMDFLGRQ
jgi:hypothetical protein